MKHLKLYEDFNVDEGIFQDAKKWVSKKVKDKFSEYEHKLGFLKKIFKPKFNINYTVKVTDPFTAKVVASWRGWVTIRAESTWEADKKFHEMAEEQANKSDDYEVDITSTSIKPFKGKEVLDFNIASEIPKRIKDRASEITKK